MFHRRIMLEESFSVYLDSDSSPFILGLSILGRFSSYSHQTALVMKHKKMSRECTHDPSYRYCSEKGS